MSESIYALLIAADFYFPNLTPQGSMFKSLKGCVRDITRVERELLIGRLNVPEKNILKLQASHADGDKPREPEQEWPTYNNIVAKFNELMSMAEPGSQVYIHYSGHGGRARTAYKQLKGNDGIDEVIVPIDIEDVAASRYFRDLELAYFLHKLAERQAVVTLMLDSCHSGGMTRGGGEDVAIRGTQEIDERKRPTDSLVTTHKALIENWTAMLATTGLKDASGWLPEPRGYVMLAACKQNESAIEYAFNGSDRNGALTHWLLYALQQMGSNISWKQVHDIIIAKISSQFSSQTPQLEGEVARQVFGLARIPPVYAVRVLQLDALNNRVELNTGEALGTAVATAYAIFPSNTTDFTDVSRRLAMAEITDLGSTRSWAKITESSGPLNFIGDEKAVMIDSGVAAIRGRVRLVEGEPPPPPENEREAALEAVAKAIPQTGRGFLKLVGRGEAANYQVAVNGEGSYEVLDPQGVALKNLRPALKAGVQGAAGKVVERLVHLYKYDTIQQLKNPDAFSPLAGKLLVEIFKAPAGAKSFKPPAEPPEPLAGPGGMPLIKSGSKFYLHIKNGSSQDLNISVLNLDSDWSIDQVVPPDNFGSDTFPLDAKKDLWLVFTASLNKVYAEGQNILKVFATVGNASFRFLELPALDQPFASLRSKRNTSGILEQLLADFNDENPRTRDVKLELDASSEWVVAEATIHISQN